MADDRNEQENAPRFRITTVPAPQDAAPLQVHLVGILGADPRLQHTSAPMKYQHHPLLRNRFFYTIPEQLLMSVCQPQVGETFEIDEELLELEFELSRLSDDHGSRVGYWRDRVIACDLLGISHLRREDLRRFDSLSEDQANAILHAVNERLLSFSEIACGYAGWLMTNPDFLWIRYICST